MAAQAADDVPSSLTKEERDQNGAEYGVHSRHGGVGHRASSTASVADASRYRERAGYRAASSVMTASSPASSNAH